jgi:hypothetical protein
MHFALLLAAGVLAPTIGLAAPAQDVSQHDGALYKRDNLCSLKAPPALCQPNATVGVEETAQRAYRFYRAFVVDGDPKTMFSLIDSVYKVNNPSNWRERLPPLRVRHKLCIDIECDTATPCGIRGRAQHHLASFLQRKQDRN